ncbi:hypothetical protein LS684_04470 [Cytobacillus spongiae]|uniref:hypothetical protein n=1 Tax=Cytobacillus spongiae TaxID=2901381 RepID=UPI001F2D645E|nr:hypothetical protein [Cytobacillus spongiae]UII56726.1 hypothetical protein LS684_04470 [Cytobacillus spongiae]
MLFDGTILVAGGITITLVCLEKIFEDLGFHFLGKTLKILIPIAAMAAGVYFLETNAMLGWLR